MSDELAVGTGGIIGNPSEAILMGSGGGEMSGDSRELSTLVYPIRDSGV